MPRRKPVGCTIKQLPPHLAAKAAAYAASLNPVNLPPAGVVEPQRIAFYTTKYWGKAGARLTVGFMDGGNQAVRSRILSYMNVWSQVCGVSFVEASDPLIRISRGPGGYWSYLGTDCKMVPRSKQTMNLEGITERTPDSECMRVIAHEAGHALGAPHEHLRRSVIEKLDYNKTVRYFKQTQGWDEQTTVAQVLTPVDESVLVATPETDEMSIMCYPLPASITKDGRPIPGGGRLTRADAEFAAKVYPKEASPPPVSAPGMRYLVALDENMKELSRWECKKVG